MERHPLRAVREREREWGREMGMGNRIWGRDEYIASKDIAESPTAIAGTPKSFE